MGYRVPSSIFSPFYLVMKPVVLSLLLLVLALSGCEKEGVDALPKPTQKGLNTMGCLVDATPGCRTETQRGKAVLYRRWSHTGGATTRDAFR